jgi:tetratricopeptide (TPR) repeat protein
MAYQSMARIASSRGDLSEKQKYFGKLKELTQEAPLSLQAAMSFVGIGLDESVHGNYGTAKQIFEDGLNIFRRLRNKNFQMIMTSELGHIARHTGDMTQAGNIYRETIKGWQDLGNRSALAHQLECFAFIAIAEEEPERAIKLFGAAEALREKINSPMTDYERVEYVKEVAQLRSLLNKSDFTSLWAEGRVLTMEQAIAYALADEGPPPGR